MHAYRNKLRLRLVIALLIVLSMFLTILSGVRTSYSYADNAIISRGLVAYYSFDKLIGNRIIDESGNGHDGDVYGKANLVKGIRGKAFYFDGDTYIDIGKFTEDFSNGITIAAWVRFDENRYWSRIVDLGNGKAEDNIILSQMDGEDSINFEVYTSEVYSSNTDWYTQKIIVPHIIKWGKWMHIAVVGKPEGDHLQVKVYINGKLQKTFNYYGEPNTITNRPRKVVRTKCYIAKSNWEVDELLKGAIDELYIFNRPLTSQEVYELYTAPQIQRTITFTYTRSVTRTVTVTEPLWETITKTITVTSTSTVTSTRSITRLVGYTTTVTRTSTSTTTLTTTLMKPATTLTHIVKVTETTTTTKTLVEHSIKTITSTKTVTARETSTYTYTYEKVLNSKPSLVSVVIALAVLVAALANLARKR